RSWQHAIRQWQSSSLAKEAVKYERLADEYRATNKTMEYQDMMVRAFKTSSDAFTKDPENLEAARVTARIYTRAGANESRWLWDRVKKLGTMTDDDVGWQIQSLSTLKEDKTAADQIEQVLRERPATQKIVELADKVMQNIGRSQQLISILRDYTKQKPDDLDTRLVLGMRLVEFGSTERDKLEGIDILWRLAVNNAPVGLRSIEFIDKLNLTPEGVRRLIERLENHPLAKEPHKIAALKRRVALEPARKEEILTAAVESHRGKKREELVPLAHWLYEVHDSERILSLLKEDEVRDYPPLLHEYFNALSLLERYDDLERLVKDPRSRFTNAERDYHLVHLAFVKSTLSKKPLDEIDGLLVNAVNSALRENQVQLLLELGHYADVRKRYRTAMEAYKAASTTPVTELAGYEGMLRASYNLGSMKEYRTISHETVRRWPSNQFFIEQYIYACLLSGEAIETSAERAKRMLADRPKDSQSKLLMALASQRYGDREACARHLQDCIVADLTPGQQGVYCGLARGVGLSDEAQKFAAAIPEGTLMLPEEEKFFRYATAQSEPAVSLQ
ncbi:MAG: hypothetical protein K8R87_02380, partial [Verrucomicrobia bacterium]|nr:hypothetical protein [Verrucomicrobiota bacterium]